MERQYFLFNISSQQNFIMKQRQQQYQSRANCIYFCVCSEGIAMDKNYFFYHIDKQHKSLALQLKNSQLQKCIKVYEQNNKKIFFLKSEFNKKYELWKNKDQKPIQQIKHQCVDNQFDTQEQVTYYQCFCGNLSSMQSQLKGHVNYMHKEHALFFFNPIHQKYLNELEKKNRQKQKMFLFYDSQIMRDYIYKKKIGDNKFVYQLQYFNVTKKIEETILLMNQNQREAQRNINYIFEYIKNKQKLAQKQPNKKHLNYSLTYIANQFISSQKNNKHDFLISRATLKQFFNYLDEKYQKICSQKNYQNQIYFNKFHQLTTLKEALLILQAERQEIIEFILSKKNTKLQKLKKEEINKCIQDFSQQLKKQLKFEQKGENLFYNQLQKQSHENQIKIKRQENEICCKRVVCIEEKIPADESKSIIAVTQKDKIQEQYKHLMMKERNDICRNIYKSIQIQFIQKSKSKRKKKQQKKFLLNTAKKIEFFFEQRQQVKKQQNYCQVNLQQSIAKNNQNQL